MRSKLHSASVVVVACGLTGSAAADFTIYSQPTVTDPSLVGLGFYSSNTPRPTRSFKHADDFTMTSDATLTGVRWWGWSEAIDHLDLTNFSRFLIEIFDVHTTPGGISVGSLLFSERFEIADTAPVATGRTAFDTGAFEMRQRVTFTTPYTLHAAHTYFLAISARSINFASDAWAWQDGLFVNGTSHVFSHTNQTWTRFQDTDSAFELIGVPGPGTVGALGLVGFAAFRRRRGSTAH